MTQQNSLGEVNSSQNQNTGTENITSSAAPTGQTPEKLLRQSEVTAIAGRAKQEGYDKAVRELSEQYRSPQATPQPIQQPPVSQPQQQQTQQAPVSGTAPLTADQVQRMIYEHSPQAFAQQLQQQQMLNTNVQYIQKLEAGKTGITDFDTKVAALNLPQHQELIPLLNSADGSIAANVILDLAENPRKFADLKVLNMMNPNLAAIEYNKLVESVKQNKAASQQKLPNDPLSQVKTSVTGTDNGSLTVSDIRRKPQYKV